MRRRRWLIGAGLAGAIAAPALACDPEEMNAQLTAVCEAALAEAVAAVEAALPHVREAERVRIDHALAEARDACTTGDPVLGAREAARLARLAGRIEARAGSPLWQQERGAR